MRAQYWFMPQREDQQEDTKKSYFSLLSGWAEGQDRGGGDDHGDTYSQICFGHHQVGGVVNTHNCSLDLLVHLDLFYGVCRTNKYPRGWIS